jgi:hypothetical protein
MRKVSFWKFTLVTLQVNSKGVEMTKEQNMYISILGCVDLVTPHHLKALKQTKI